MLDQKKLSKNVRSHKVLVQKIKAPKNLGPKKILGPKKCSDLVPKSLGPKIEVEKNLGPKYI